jgi:hypothetical protein
MPKWQSPSALPTVVTMLSGMLDEIQVQLQRLRAVQRYPRISDGRTVSHILQVYGEQEDSFWVYEAQLDFWREGALTDEQWQQAEQMAAQIAQIKPKLSEIVAIASDLQDQIFGLLSENGMENSFNILSDELGSPL